MLQAIGFTLKAIFPFRRNWTDLTFSLTIKYEQLSSIIITSKQNVERSLTSHNLDSTESTWDIVVSVCGTFSKLFTLDFKKFQTLLQFIRPFRIERTIQLNKNHVVNVYRFTQNFYQLFSFLGFAKIFIKVQLNIIFSFVDPMAHCI